jgi:hypothetical protein
MQPTRRSLIVSIHDVSPLTMDRTRTILSDLHHLGLPRTSLLVIPNHHHRAPVKDHPDFAANLRAFAAEGHEIVLHGYYHLRPKTGDSRISRFTTEIYTAGEGEFFDLDHAAAAERLSRGRADLAACGTTTVGFIAPAWLLGDAALRAVREAGFRYTTTINTIQDLKDNRTTATRSMVWSVRAPWRRTLSLAWNRALASALRSTEPLRIGLHPPDWDHPHIRSQILRLTSRALAARTPMTYQDWLR